MRAPPPAGRASAIANPKPKPKPKPNPNPNLTLTLTLTLIIPACGPSEHESAITKVIAMCAIASVAYVGMLHTVIPLAAARVRVRVRVRVS